MHPDTPAAPARAAHGTLAHQASLLRDQQARKVDVVAPAAAIRARGGHLVVDNSVPLLREDGVIATAGAYAPTGVCDQGIADKLGIPAGYLRRLREERPDLYDANVNGWLEADDRKFLVRCLRPELGPGPGVARAFLSDGYKIIDNLDVQRNWAGLTERPHLVVSDSVISMSVHWSGPGSRRMRAPLPYRAGHELNRTTAEAGA